MIVHLPIRTVVTQSQMFFFYSFYLCIQNPTTCDIHETAKS